MGLAHPFLRIQGLRLSTLKTPNALERRTVSTFRGLFSSLKDQVPGVCFWFYLQPLDFCAFRVTLHKSSACMSKQEGFPEAASDTGEIQSVFSECQFLCVIQVLGCYFCLIPWAYEWHMRGLFPVNHSSGCSMYELAQIPVGTKPWGSGAPHWLICWEWAPPSAGIPVNVIIIQNWEC